MLETLENHDIPYSIHKVVPFEGTLIPEPKLDTKNVMCIGSYSMRHMAKANGWYPGVFDMESVTHDVLMQSPWGNGNRAGRRAFNKLLNADGRVVPFKHAKFDEPMFVRPANDSKVINGKVYDPDEWCLWQDHVMKAIDDGFEYLGLDENTPLVIAKPKSIKAEYRFWIHDNEIITSSLYKVGNRVMYRRDMVDDRIKTFVYSLINPISVDYWKPPVDAYVLDVCEMEDEKLKIVEVNTLNSTGFYDADVNRLIITLNDWFTYNA